MAKKDKNNPSASDPTHDDTGSDNAGVGASTSQSGDTGEGSEGVEGVLSDVEEELEEFADEAQDKLREYGDQLRHYWERAVDYARRNPVPASLIAVAAGYAVGRLTRRVA